ncbi:MAG: hypothetical protein KDC79_14940 [Cyclobacteriaceae bacterium]|nr:hypothetical protein [Cyclobacteriaceae bacterium]
MTKSQKTFLTAALIFLAIVLYIAWDMSQRTTAPWNKHKKEPAKTEVQKQD